MTKAGNRCQALVGSDGLCSAHGGRTNMRELGHRGGKGRRKGVAERLPEGERLSLRQALRDRLDPDVVVEATERDLAGGNESARVAAVKFLADLELFRRDGEQCPRCAQIPNIIERTREKLDDLIDRRVHAQAVQLAQERVEQLAQERLQAYALTEVRRLQRVAPESLLIWTLRYLTQSDSHSNLLRRRSKLGA